jgi:LemA protein
MKGKWIASAAIIIGLIVVSSFAFLYFSTYNNLVRLNASTDESWAQVEQELQRRYDLIPRVVNASELYIKYEGSILENITRLRSQWENAVQSGNLSSVDDATNQLESGVSKLVVTFEAYPDLKASQVVQDLMITLEGTENRISTERMRYNEAVRDYNIAIQSFPANLFASGWGFESRTYFQAKVGAQEPPPVPA